MDIKHKERLAELADWIRPLKVSLDPDNYDAWANQIKQYKEDGCELTGSLVTVCRIIKDLVKPLPQLESKFLSTDIFYQLPILTIN